MKKITICALITVGALTISNNVSSQVTMDLELLGGITLNGNSNNYSDETYSFELKNGVSYGLGFDIWFPQDYGLTFGFRHVKSTGLNTLNYPEGFVITSQSFSSGTLEDRIFYLGAKKRFYWDAKRSWSITPHVGFSCNPFIFDNDDVSYIESFQFDDYLMVESRYTYSRFNTADVGDETGYLGSFGGRVGVGIEKKIPNIGTFSLSAVYTLDLRKSVDRSLYMYQTATLTENSSGAQQTFAYQLNETNTISRNMLTIEIGFKMPASIILSKGKKRNDGMDVLL